MATKVKSESSKRDPGRVSYNFPGPAGAHHSATIIPAASSPRGYCDHQTALTCSSGHMLRDNQSGLVFNSPSEWMRFVEGRNDTGDYKRTVISYGENLPFRMVEVEKYEKYEKEEKEEFRTLYIKSYYEESFCEEDLLYSESFAKLYTGGLYYHHPIL
jgi:hypothetical protein